MKYAIPAEKASIESTVASSFGRTSYFAVFNTDNDSVVFVDNTAIAQQGGAGVKAAQLLVDNSVDAVITPQCGQNAANVLQAANIILWKSEGESIQENSEKFTKKQLKELTEIHSGYHKKG